MTVLNLAAYREPKLGEAMAAINRIAEDFSRVHTMFELEATADKPGMRTFEHTDKALLENLVNWGVLYPLPGGRYGMTERVAKIIRNWDVLIDEKNKLWLTETESPQDNESVGDPDSFDFDWLNGLL